MAFQLRNQFKKKLLPGAEVASIMVGEVDFLKKPFPVFIRLREAVTLGSLTEVALPSSTDSGLVAHSAVSVPAASCIP